MLPAHANDTYYDNPGMQALLEIEKALIRKKEGSWTHYGRGIGTSDVDRFCCGLHSSANARHPDSALC
jgi:hypothetical protein